MPTPKTEGERRAGGYDKRPNELITAREAVLLIDTRVSVLLAHWEDERRTRERQRRPLYRLHRWCAIAFASLRSPRDEERR